MEGFIVHNDTLDLIAFIPRENGKDLFKPGIRMKSSSPFVSLLDPQSHVTF